MVYLGYKFFLKYPIAYEINIRNMWNTGKHGIAWTFQILRFYLGNKVCLKYPTACDINIIYIYMKNKKIRYCLDVSGIIYLGYKVCLKYHIALDIYICPQYIKYIYTVHGATACPRGRTEIFLGGGGTKYQYDKKNYTKFTLFSNQN